MMYSYHHSRTCHCPQCRGVGEKSSDRALNASVARLAASLSPPEPPLEATSMSELMRASGKAPWEMSAAEFDASAALRLVPVWGSNARRLERVRQPPEQRSLGLKRSYLREGMELRLDVEWAPTGGYVVLVSKDDETMPNDPRRAFVKAALGRGIAVSAEILAVYPDLTGH